jgi:hypothetical protein
VFLPLCCSAPLRRLAACSCCLILIRGVAAARRLRCVSQDLSCGLTREGGRVIGVLGGKDAPCRELRGPCVDVKRHRRAEYRTALALALGGPGRL